MNFMPIIKYIKLLKGTLLLLLLLAMHTPPYCSSCSMWIFGIKLQHWRQMNTLVTLVALQLAPAASFVPTGTASLLPHQVRFPHHRLDHDVDGSNSHASTDLVFSVSSTSVVVAQRRSFFAAAISAAAGAYLLRSPVLTWAQPPASFLCDQTVSHLVDPFGRELWLVGTAHISDVSAILVQNTIRWRACASISLWLYH
jgi:hypothetical protein